MEKQNKNYNINRISTNVFSEHVAQRACIESA